jgi:putative ABC transport system permease protein
MTFTGFVAKSLLRNKGRTFLTVLGVAVAILTFITLRTLVWSFTSGADNAVKDRVVTRHKVTFVMTLPKKYIDDVRNTKGVRVATYANWFGGRDPKKENEFFATLGVEVETLLKVYDEIELPPADLQAWKEDRQGAIVGDLLANKMGWKKGDKIILESGIFPADPDKPWSFNIVGIYTTKSKVVDRSTVYFNWEYLNEGLPPRVRDQIGWIVSRVQTTNDAANVGRDIDRIFDVRDTQTLSQDEAAFNKSFLAGISSVLGAVDIISGVILAIMMLVLGNTIAMGVRERTAEYGVLRAIGFLPKHLALFVLGEALLVGGLGAVLGIALSYPITERGLGRFLEENLGGIFVSFRVPVSTMVIAFALALLLGLLASAIPAWSSSKLKVTEALRRVA